VPSVQDRPLILLSSAGFSVVLKLDCSERRVDAQQSIAIDNALVSDLLHHGIIVPELREVIEQESGERISIFVRQSEPSAGILHCIAKVTKKLYLIVFYRYDGTIVKIDEAVPVAVAGADIDNTT